MEHLNLRTFAWVIIVFGIATNAFFVWEISLEKPEAAAFLMIGCWFPWMIVLMFMWYHEEDEEKKKK